MAIERPINIRTNAPGASPRVSFDPNPLQANPADQVFWTNNDSQPHWPGRVDDTGKVQPDFFMSYQIAPNGGTSPVFSTVVVGTLKYVCTIKGHENETGSIVIKTQGT
jgi:plastocyanin